MGSEMFIRASSLSSRRAVPWLPCATPFKSWFFRHNHYAHEGIPQSPWIGCQHLSTRARASLAARLKERWLALRLRPGSRSDFVGIPQSGACRCGISLSGGGTSISYACVSYGYVGWQKGGRVRGQSHDMVQLLTPEGERVANDD